MTIPKKSSSALIVVPASFDSFTGPFCKKKQLIPIARHLRYYIAETHMYMYTINACMHVCIMCIGVCIHMCVCIHIHFNIHIILYYIHINFHIHIIFIFICISYSFIFIFISMHSRLVYTTYLKLWRNDGP